MYLFDTNIFLEVLLLQERADDCKKVLADKAGSIVISDFSLHSIGVILFRKKKESAFSRFAEDIFLKADIVSLSSVSYGKVAEIREKYNLDFDDSYQYNVAEENGLTIITMDRDFERVKNSITVKFI
jgi:predicted nucleic acid-binding protein